MPGGEYRLDRNPAESKRLNEQNELLIEAFGYVIHPDVKKTLPPNPKIAEPGCGTGALLVSMLEDVPGAQAHGFDISDAAFPPVEERPASLTLSVSDMRQPAPPEHVGQYDLVSMRYLNAALPDHENWGRAVDYAYSLLKPGGALQWQDGNFHQLWPPYQSNVDTKVDVMNKVTTHCIATNPGMDWFVKNLVPLLRAAGFERVEQKVMSSDRVADRARASRVWIRALYAVMLAQIKAGMPGAWPESEVELLMQGVLEEIDAGAYLRFDLHQFIAWKKE